MIHEKINENLTPLKTKTKQKSKIKRGWDKNKSTNGKSNLGLLKISDTLE